MDSIAYPFRKPDTDGKQQRIGRSFYSIFRPIWLAPKISACYLENYRFAETPTGARSREGGATRNASASRATFECPLRPLNVNATIECCEALSAVSICRAASLSSGKYFLSFVCVLVRGGYSITFTAAT
ncbi:MAG: hypothetical protein ABSC37_21530, partial [Xanthobacteraceae bacterium]